MTDTSSDSIWIVTDEAPQITVTEGTKGITGNTRSWREETTETTKSAGDAVKVSTQKLEQEMTHFLEVVGRLFSRAEQQAKTHNGMQLDEIELSVEISGEGEVKLIGNGAKAGGKGAIKLVFRRQEPK
ncbi:Pepco domain-containing protein [Aliinostoc sp. HNIBRCY26]|uniref:Pepco domain-containing protein n=1 Tax=Aliinostoc sp. HNIBRCY26 TaxID=3418997 RepID=UPI003D05DEFD